jgi:hypothetical protein
MTILDDLALQEREYLDCQYPEDLGHLVALHGADLSLMIFTKAAHPPTIRRWTEHFALIERKTDFLFCLFLHVLIDQSLHFTGQKGSLELLRDWTGELREPRLRGILATAHSDISPFLLLVAAALWADSEGDAGGKLVAYSLLFRDRCEDLGLPYDVLITEAIAEEARAFAKDYRVMAKTAYFQGQSPDMQLLESWSGLLLREFSISEVS